MFDTGQLSYANILKCACVLALGLICYRRSLREDVPNRFWFFLNLAGLVVYCCGSFIPEVSRVGYYMIISQVFLIPRLLGDMPKGWFGRFAGQGWSVRLGRISYCFCGKCMRLTSGCCPI